MLRGTRGSEQEIKDLLTEDEFKQITFLYADLIHYRSMDKIFKEHSFDKVFHLAAQTHPPTSFKDPIGTWESNVMGSVNLMTAILDNQPKCHFIFCSTVEVYGNEGIDGRKINENNVILPANPYGASKCAIDLYVGERMKNKEMNATVIRPFCFTGPRRGSRFSIASDAVQIAAMMLNKQERVLQIGNLDTIRAVTDVRDIANAFYLVAMNPDVSIGKVYNVCGGEPLKMREYTNMLIKFSGLTNITMNINDNLWIGTQSGLNVINLNDFDNNTYHIKHYFFDNKLLSGDDILSIFQDKKGKIWIGTKAKGLYEFDGTNFNKINSIAEKFRNDGWTE